MITAIKAYWNMPGHLDSAVGISFNTKSLAQFNLVINWTKRLPVYSLESLLIMINWSRNRGIRKSSGAALLLIQSNRSMDAGSRFNCLIEGCRVSSIDLSPVYVYHQWHAQYMYFSFLQVKGDWDPALSHTQVYQAWSSHP